MLSHLHVKNFALIDEADVDFGSGLNILTGETGAGKSILIDAVNAALGQKVSGSVIRKGAEYAYIELMFSIDEAEKLEAVRELDIVPEEDGTIIVTRKIMAGKSMSRINDEAATLSKLRRLTSLLLDIHGQHEHQSLLSDKKHLEILDLYGKETIRPEKQKVEKLYQEYAALMKEYASFDMDEDVRLRQLDFIRFEIGEIEDAAIRQGEEEELEARHKVCASGAKIAAALNEVKKEIGYDGAQAAGEAVDRAIHSMAQITGLDSALDGIASQLTDLEAVLNDCNRAVSDYLDDLVIDEEELAGIRKRLDLIRTIESKYGNKWELIQGYLAEKYEQLKKLEHYEEQKKIVAEQLQKTEERLKKASGRLSALRKKASKSLCGRIADGLSELNFENVELTMEFCPLKEYTKNGTDQVQFLISTNVGEEPKPLHMVASGGELSRIMLAAKTVLADDDDIPTLIFDEIDTGISGRTAQMVSEKLSYIGRNHQVLCITHLPQIASMADRHYLIEKSSRTGKTETRIHKLDGEESVTELARLLGGAQITEAVLENAREMKKLAEQTKLTK